MSPVVFITTLLVTLLSLSSFVEAHGWMSNPVPRGKYHGKYDYQEFEPVVSNNPNTDRMVCRGDAAIPNKANWLSLKAGESTPITLSWNAPHIGDCFVYLTYDGDKPEKEMKWFKIWEQAKCSPDSRPVSNYNVPIPSYLPPGDHVIFRWEWYALHAFPTVEFYVNCVDATITGDKKGNLPLPQIQIPGNLPNNAAGNYWNPYDGSAERFVGAPVATPNGEAWEEYSQNKKKSNGGAIAAGILVPLIVVGLIAVALFVLHKKHYIKFEKSFPPIKKDTAWV